MERTKWWRVIPIGLLLLVAVPGCSLRAARIAALRRGPSSVPEYEKQDTWAGTLIAYGDAWSASERKRLEGARADATRAVGLELGRWFHAGPFDAEGDDAHAEVLGPEGAEDPRDAAEWREEPDWADGEAHYFGQEPDSASFVYRLLDAKRAGALPVFIGSDDGLKVWLNGALVRESAEGLGMQDAPGLVRLEVKPGRNLLMLKISNRAGPTGFRFSMTRGVAGGPIPRRVREEVLDRLHEDFADETAAAEMQREFGDGIWLGAWDRTEVMRRYVSAISGMHDKYGPATDGEALAGMTGEAEALAGDPQSFDALRAVYHRARVEAESAWRAATDAAIREHRMGTLIVRAAPGARVKVMQVRHAFEFGTAIAAWMFGDGGDPAEKARYQDMLKRYFNAAVHENALKWYSTGARPGPPNWEPADRSLEWCEENGIPMRGHCIFWAVDRNVPGWVRELDDAALREAVAVRAREVTERYAGRIGEYDLNNEMLHGRFFRERLGEGVLDEMFRLAREPDPGAVLYVNDYNVLVGNSLADYEAQIRELLDRGLPVGGIGLQGHLWGALDLARARDSLARLGRFGLPVKISEFDVVGDEATKAQTLEYLYRECMAQPAVEGIYMWGFWEGAHWRQGAALWKRDWTPTPAAEAYIGLVYGEWWTDWEGTADADGECEVPAFYGTLRVESGDASQTVELTKDSSPVTVTFAN